MRPVILCPYSIRVMRMHSKEEEPLSEFGDKGTDLLEFLNVTMNGLAAGNHCDKVAQRSTSAREINRAGRAIRGILETGDTAQEAKLKMSPVER
jgi:hypothetical protein